MFIRVRVSRGDGEALHIDSGLLEFLDGVFGLIVGVIDGDYRICIDHRVLQVHRLTEFVRKAAEWTALQRQTVLLREQGCCRVEIGNSTVETSIRIEIDSFTLQLQVLSN